MYKDRDTERLERAARNFDCQPEEIRCEGCRGPSESHWSPDCQFAACAAEQNLTFCHECTRFPCQDLAVFSADRQDLPLANLRRLAEVGPEAWLAEQEARWRCLKCGRPVDIYSPACWACGADLGKSAAENLT